MESLATLASRRIPISQIWEENVLGQPLPTEQLMELRSRITIDNLYREGLLTSEDKEIDSDLFAFAVENNVPNFIWPYLSEALGRSVSYPTSPFSDTSRDYMERVEGILPENYDAALESAVRNFLNDVTNIITNPSGIVQQYDNLTIAYAVARNPSGGEDIYKVLSVRIIPESQDSDVEAEQAEFGVSNPFEVSYFDTLDDVLRYILAEMEAHARIQTLQGIYVQSDFLEPDIRIALIAMGQALHAELDEIWRMLEEGTIRLNTEPQLVIEGLHQDSTLLVLGKFLFIVNTITEENIYAQQVERGSELLYYYIDDGKAIISSLYIANNKWSYQVDEPYQADVDADVVESLLSQEVN